ncbi:uncharacterized protein LOC117782011 [Drosophila innubila]|uniref:uncharacterized protein LOC117782011 n=1 Tax=Drosophila innubila TaxID=198719 RepID=UPI00148BD764|nr:uncharacterized protein LOC117782011 [Drosophila innubila]
MDFEDSAYTLEFFNFTPEQITNERDNLVKMLIKKSVETTMRKIETPATSALLAQQKDAVMCRIQTDCEKKLDCLRELDRKTFQVPTHVLAMKDFELEQQLTSDDEETKAQQFEELKLRYRQNMAMLAELKAEQTKFTSIAPSIDRELQMHHLIREACANSDHKNVYKFALNLLENVTNE